MQRKTRRALRILATSLALLGVVLGAAELTLAVALRSLRPMGGAPPAGSLRVPGPLLVGAATRTIELPSQRALAGFGLFRPLARGSTGPWEARAVVIGKLAIVSLDVLEIPPSLSAVVSQSVGPDFSVWLCASHTHSGPGGYDPGRLPQLVGARRFEPGVFNALAEAASSAVSAAAWGARPAKVRWATASHPELKVGRSPGADPDSTLWAMQAEDADGEVIATLLAFGAHPTLVSRRQALASADWPGVAAEALARRGGVGLAVQAIGGDSSAVISLVTDDDRRIRYGENVASAALRALASAPATAIPDEELAQAPARLSWNPLELVHLRLPGTTATVETTVRMASLGNVRLICLPGEITGAAWHDLTTFNPGLKDALPLTLCGDELSYVESPRLSHQGEGERLILYPQAVPELGLTVEHLLRTLSQQ